LLRGKAPIRPHGASADAEDLLEASPKRVTTRTRFDDVARQKIRGAMASLQA
jgi:hypothetical protein